MRRTRIRSNSARRLFSQKALEGPPKALYHRRENVILEGKRGLGVERPEVGKETEEPCELHRAPVRPHTEVEGDLVLENEHAQIGKGDVPAPNVFNHDVEGLGFTGHDERGRVGHGVDGPRFFRGLRPELAIVGHQLTRSIQEEGKSPGYGVRVRVVYMYLGQGSVIRVEEFV